ncbi:dephospho-CoA kinase [Campylobacter sp. 19-13652]|uniref:dephospho-CoA kinase n=1 Tax=Campylobacter sp. 19-13652 TaxID=2840180 RepID=UPI001C74FECA|nr:dephospho-CoA kinase [Campylobacter sp. 19-13652]BCX78633.1 dephospho-CoA kinase [Campylobacter sp. 19-13652]
MAIFKHSFCITGSIGSGKSTLCALLKTYGFSVIDADIIAHKVLDKNADKVACEFGESVLENGRVDRARLGAIVFGDRAQLARLEAIVSMDIRDEIFSECGRLSALNLPYFVDIPLYFEKEQIYGGCFEEVVLVYAPKQVLLSRVKARNNLSDDEALFRIEAQIDIELKREKASIIIQNSGSLKQLQGECERLIALIKERYESIKI